MEAHTQTNDELVRIVNEQQTTIDSLKRQLETAMEALTTIRHMAEHSITSPDIDGDVELELSNYIDIADKVLTDKGEDAQKVRCSDCEGRGYVHPEAGSCLRCNGTGRARVEEPMINPESEQKGGF
jgi:hypothetical protein